ncbi:MAG: penicillin acylase family protein [Acidilobaceae archaeon]|nr:penicillin acylase family protein [Acidilobaceae archaeon]MDW7973809.1 penicillin acylase family protein [Sulfolobales archaeon]
MWPYAPKFAAALLLIAAILAPTLNPLLPLFLDPFHGLAGSGRIDLPSGALRTPAGESRIEWDSANVPTIRGESEEAVAYALGYLSASLRLFQADLQRRLPQGRLAELVGDIALESDRLMRTLGMHLSIQRSWERLKASQEGQRAARLIELYVQGFNDYLSRLSPRDLPPEYRLLGLRPEPWRPEDVMATQKLFTIMLALDNDDLILNELVRRWGVRVIVDLDMIERKRATPQASCAFATPWSSAARTVEGSYGNVSSADVLRYFRESMILWRELYPYLGSNSWAVRGEHTKSGVPIVANDPHLALTAPSLWFVVRLQAPGLSVAGVTVPGAPSIVIGMNRDIAWSFTSLVGDFVDFYYYVWRGDEYFYLDDWRRAERREEVIRVWDPRGRSYREVRLTVLETIHGPVLERGAERFAVAFTGREPSLEVLFLWELSRAKNVTEALRAQRHFVAPVQNFLVADRYGNIAYSPTGAYPLRRNVPVIREGELFVVNNGLLPFNGSRAEGEWVGYIDYSQLPVLLNPPLPFVVTANTKPWDGKCGAHTGWHWADRFRQDRITELLRGAVERGKVGVEEVMRIQVDVSKDLSLSRYVSILLRLRPDAELLSWLEAGARTEPELYEPAIALSWMALFHQALWDRLGSPGPVSFLRMEYAEELLELYLAGDERAYRYLPRGEAERMAEETLVRAREIVSKHFQGRAGKYGEFLYFDPRHPVLRAFDLPRAQAGGGFYSVSPAFPSEVSERGAPVRGGASVRLIADLAEGKLYVALPGGSHGNPHSPLYSDHYKRFWSRGLYHVLSIS